MINNLKNEYKLISSEKEINEFIDKKEDTIKILKAIEPPLKRHFPDSEFSI